MGFREREGKGRGGRGKQIVGLLVVDLPEWRQVLWVCGVDECRPEALDHAGQCVVPSPLLQDLYYLQRNFGQPTTM